VGGGLGSGYAYGLKQQQEYITEKNSSVATSCLLTKNNLVQKTSKSDEFLWLLHKRTQVLITFQHYHVTQHLVGHIQCWKQDQRYKTKTTAGLRV